MAAPPDFRTQPLALDGIADCGRYAGRSSYWRLYVIENLVRVIAHSVLTVQINPNWWSVAVSTGVDRKVQSVKSDYRAQPNRANPGSHDIYYLFLPDLTKIVANHAHLFRQIIPDIDVWVARLEQIRLPRNVVSHMNWLNHADRTDVDILYTALKSLYRRLRKSGINLLVP